MIGRAVAPLLALVVALAVPTSQLRLITIEHHCCCPDPDRCQCPDDAPAKVPTLGVCRSVDRAFASAPAPAFTAPVVAVAEVATAEAIVAAAPLAAPHPPPAPRRPDAPS